MPWDSASAPLVKAVHERLAIDTRDQSIYVIPHAEFVQFVKVAGFDSLPSLKPLDVKGLGQLVRADLVVALQVSPKDSRVHVEASAIDPGDGVVVRILDGDGSVSAIADVLVRALHSVPAYKRLLRAQTDATSAARDRGFEPVFSFRFRLQPDSNGRMMTPVIVDTTRRTFSFRFLSANTWKAGFFADTTRRLTAFRFRPATYQWFTRFSFDTTGRVTRFSRPPLG